MAIKLSGLASGLDTESIIEQLMEAQSYKKTKLVNKQTKLTWTQDKWKELNTKIYALYTEQLSKLRLQSTYQTKSATSSNEDKVTVTAGATAASGSQTISVSQLASSQYVTGGQLGGNVTESTKLTDMGFTAGSADSKITIAGTSVVELEISDTTTVKDFVNACKNAGLNASFDEKQQRFFISSKDSGENQRFTITTGNASSVVVAEETIKSALDYDSKNLVEQAEISQALDTLKAASNAELKELFDNTSTNENQKKAYELLVNHVNATTEANYDTQIKKDTTSAIGTEEQYIKSELMTIVSNENPTATDDEKEKLVEEKYKALSADDKAVYSDSYKVLYDQKYKELYDQDIDKVRSAAINELNSSLEQISADSNAAVGGSSPLENLGLQQITGAALDGVVASASNKMTLVAATDAKYTLNGVDFTSSSNSATVNGVTFTFKGITDKEETISVSNNTQGVYDMIKGFIKQYNSVLGDMNTAYYANSSKGYDPLTDEEKEAMTDSQIEMWENKIKDSLLRRDSSLGGVMTAMKSAMMSTVTVDGKEYSLSSFGICTSTDYTEKGLLHIYGDSDDAVYAAKTDKLMTAIEEDPDLVMQVFTGIVTNVYNAVNDKMKATSLSSALTVYNDKQMTKLQTQYEKDLKKLESRLQDIEDRYYKQFSAMETALAKINSQSSYLSGLFA